MSNLSKFLEQRIADVNTEFDAIVAERKALRSQGGPTGDGTLSDAEFAARADEYRARANRLAKRADELKADLPVLKDRLAEVQNEEESAKRAFKIQFPQGAGSGSDGQHRASAGGVRIPNAQVISEEPVYRQDDAQTGRSSFFRDVYGARRGDWQAAERLSRNNVQMGMSTRALSTSAGAGGQFAPPLWLVQEWIKLARPSRVTADLLHKEALPYGVSSINIPAVATGSTTGVVQTQNTAVSMTDLTTTSASSGITTISGQQQVSQMLIDQSGVPFDQVILADLAADYSKQLDVQVISGTGANGQLKGLVAWGTAGTWTTTQPAVASTTATNSFQAQVVKFATALANTRFAPADALVMSPERWGWISEAVDGQGRPLVPPAASGGTLNSFGSAGDPTAQGAAGSFAGLPVFVDPALTVASGNETVLVLRRDDSWLWESELFVQSFDATYANQLTVLFRVHAYASLIARYAASVQAVSGSGLVKVTLG